jgi:mutual gliding-motility protein MglA
MSFTNFENKEIHAKVLYFGAEGAGKTENLRSLYQRLTPRSDSDSVFVGETQNPYEFEFLPLSLSQIGDYHVKLHLFTLPSYEDFEVLPTFLLRGLDGVVFVVDSRVSASFANIEAYKKLEELFKHHDIDINQLVRIVQYNKRDLNHLVSIPTLKSELNKTQSWIDVEAIASQGRGTFETLTTMAEGLVRELQS